MVDPTRVVRLLQRVGEESSHLRARACEDRAALRADEVRLSALKYRFITTLEALLNVAHHLCASEAWGPPSTNAAAIELLGRHGVMDGDLAGRLAKAVGLRNVLVHQYDEVDDDRVVSYLDRLRDIDEFVAAVSSWLDAHLGETTT